jgi:hypothetical protein
MKGFGKIALLFGLLGGLMAYFIVPLHFSRKRNLSPTDKAEYALTVDYYKAIAVQSSKRSRSAPESMLTRAGRTFGPAFVTAGHRSAGISPSRSPLPASDPGVDQARFPVFFPRNVERDLAG